MLGTSRRRSLRRTRAVHASCRRGNPVRRALRLSWPHALPFPPPGPVRDLRAGEVLREEPVLLERAAKRLAWCTGGGQEREVVQGLRVLEKARVGGAAEVEQIGEVAVRASCRIARAWEVRSEG